MARAAGSSSASAKSGSGESVRLPGAANERPFLWFDGLQDRTGRKVKPHRGTIRGKFAWVCGLWPHLGGAVLIFDAWPAWNVQVLPYLLE